jgi:hypothetical protein
MKMKKLIETSMIFCGLLSITAQAQDNQTNLKKYWHYRYRLVNYFMAVGPNPGESLPATTRNLYEGNTIDWAEGPRYFLEYLCLKLTCCQFLRNDGFVFYSKSILSPLSKYGNLSQILQFNGFLIG